MLVFDCTSVNTTYVHASLYISCLCVRDNHVYVCVLKCSLSEDQISKRAHEDVQTKVPKETKMVTPHSVVVYNIWSCVYIVGIYMYYLEPRLERFSRNTREHYSYTPSWGMNNVLVYFLLNLTVSGFMATCTYHGKVLKLRSPPFLSRFLDSSHVFCNEHLAAACYWSYREARRAGAVKGPSLFVSVWPTCVVVVEEGPKMYRPTT